MSAYAVGRRIQTPHGPGYAVVTDDAPATPSAVVVRLSFDTWATFVGDQRTATGVRRGQACYRHGQLMKGQA